MTTVLGESVKRPLREALQELVDNQGPALRRYAGICGVLSSIPGNAHVQALMLEWPEHSGVEDYPVPHPELEAQEAYERTWDVWEGEYGAARLRLCAWLVEQLQ